MQLDNQGLVMICFVYTLDSEESDSPILKSTVYRLFLPVVTPVRLPTC